MPRIGRRHNLIVQILTCFQSYYQLKGFLPIDQITGHCIDVPRPPGMAPFDPDEFCYHFSAYSLAFGTRNRSSKFCDLVFLLKALKRKEASPIRFGMKIQVKNIFDNPEIYRYWDVYLVYV